MLSFRLLRAFGVGAACLSLGAWVVGPGAGAAAGVAATPGRAGGAATTVRTGVKVTGAVVGATADAGGAVVHAATGPRPPGGN